jgi:hypothetical protein
MLVSLAPNTHRYQCIDHLALSSFDHLSPVYCCPLIGMLWTDHILCRNSSTYG